MIDEIRILERQAQAATAKGRPEVRATLERLLGGLGLALAKHEPAV